MTQHGDFVKQGLNLPVPKERQPPGSGNDLLSEACATDLGLTEEGV
jgi:hypothetical protein